MALEAALIDCTNFIVAKLLVLSELGVREELMLVCKNLLVSCTEITIIYQSV